MFKAFSTSSTTLRVAPRRKSPKQLKRELERKVMTPEELLEKAGSTDYLKLKEEHEKISYMRYKKPNQYWLSKLLGVSKPVDYKDGSELIETKKMVRKKLETIHGSVRNVFELESLSGDHLNVGDVVDLSSDFERSGLAVIAKLPDSLADARYTLINQYGEIEFVSRHQTGVRIPNVFPKGWFEHR
ncbi:unnamed protein product [Ambrosiozyma monospora]|uniref:Unnamed protein product n=1 Tax=Ambrosiozyma monospora TaxID=43982 RepID=A0ACB5T681_AMBMO|nr:unnamed protein product [Ambrosiozyma monospora]